MESAKSRFLRYVTYYTTSDEFTGTSPSTERQKDLGRALMQELEALKLEDVHMDDCGNVLATLPASEGVDAPVIALIAHMDTAPDASGENVKPRLVRYEGGELKLNDTVSLTEALCPGLESHVGEELIVTDGTTLLGADDKAGVAEILSAAELLLTSDRKHGTVKLAFTPDEEIGRGADRFDVAGFGADYAYTVDGGAIGELEYENFNAASAKIVIRGKSIHPGSAKGQMVNAALVAMELHGLLPALETPYYTDGYEGFYHLTDLQGETERAELHYIIRDHDRAKFEDRKAVMQKVCAEIDRRYGAGTVELTLRDSYYNMKEKIEPHMYLIDLAKEAMTDMGITPVVSPVRGGTDGARLSYMGLPCPNLCTGGHNYHGRFEYVCVQSMEKVVELLLKITEKFEGYCTQVGIF